VPSGLEDVSTAKCGQYNAVAFNQSDRVVCWPCDEGLSRVPDMLENAIFIVCWGNEEDSKPEDLVMTLSSVALM
jgi:hypothetical protein